MAFIAAASIDIDATLIVAGTLSILFFGGMLLLIGYGARAAVRRICMNDDERHASRRRTRLRTSHIERHA